MVEHPVGEDASSVSNRGPLGLQADFATLGSVASLKPKKMYLCAFFEKERTCRL
jgi:hypothetical protein